MMFNRTIISVTLAVCLGACGGGGGESASAPQPTPSPPPAPTPQPTPSPAPSPAPTDVCLPVEAGVNWQALKEKNCDKLSDYQLFSDMTNPRISPQEPGQDFDLSVALFSDYAHKYRFVFIPPGQKAEYQGNDVLSFPVGTVLVKTFAMPKDTELDDDSLIETRLLIHRELGWVGLPYLWRDDKTDAELKIAGAIVPTELVHNGEVLSFNYEVPDQNQCRSCHQLDLGDKTVMTPIGPKPRYLNWPEGSENQLTQLANVGLLSGLPDIQEVQKVPLFAESENELTAVAKGYIDVNCAHCHREEGFASISGLRLGYDVDHTTFEYGVCKQPPGYDGGSLGLSWDIVPGFADQSILTYRLNALAAKDKMPPIGRAIVHTQGVELVSEWIDSLSPALGECSQ